MSKVFCVALIALCLLPSAAFADRDTDVLALGKALAEMVGAEAMFSGALDGECSQYVPANVSEWRMLARKRIAGIKEIAPPGGKEELNAMVESKEFQDELNRIKKKTVDDQLALYRSWSKNDGFSCGLLVGGLIGPLKHAEETRVQAVKQVTK